MEAKNDTVPSPRIPLQMQVEFRKSYGRQSVKGVLKNISLTGAFLETETLELLPTDKVVLEIVVSERRRKMTATIVWKNGKGCGVRFQPFNKRDTQIVDDLMYFVQNNRDFRRSLLDSIFKQAA
ncbi:MAG TPA: PilZ domain-containing protein [Bdellovibrionales bacterium]|nr:PilZ domain-containing protein [Bdellovibrionales bacterium]